MKQPSKLLIAQWREAGYVPTGRLDERGYPIWELQVDEQGNPIAGAEGVSELKVTPTPSKVGGRIPMNEDGTINVPANSSPEVLDTLKRQGWVPVTMSPDNTIVVYRKKDGGTSMGMDFGIGQIYEHLRRMLGRDPSAAEIDDAVKRQVQPGEETGRVAPFTSRPLVSDDTVQNAQNHAELFRRIQDDVSRPKNRAESGLPPLIEPNPNDPPGYRSNA